MLGVSAFRLAVSSYAVAVGEDEPGEVEVLLVVDGSGEIRELEIHQDLAGPGHELGMNDYGSESQQDPDSDMDGNSSSGLHHGDLT